MTARIHRNRPPPERPHRYKEKAMISYSNSTTDRLEGYARARGLVVGVAKTPGNATGLWHAISRDGRPLSRWTGLGWSVVDARRALSEMAALAAEEGE